MRGCGKLARVLALWLCSWYDFVKEIGLKVQKGEISLTQLSFFDNQNYFDLFYNRWRAALIDEYDDESTYSINPTVEGSSIFLYGNVFFKLTSRVSGIRLSIPSTILRLPNAIQPAFAPLSRIVYKPKDSDAEERQSDCFVYLVDDTFDLQTFLDWSRSMKPVVFRSLGSDVFGCCNDFERCSDAKSCLHPHEIFYNHCMYRDNLESGHIFYGKNKTV